MKNKPVKHRTENTFRFQTFSERLSNINVDVIHRVGLTKNVPFEAETFLQESVNKWTELNCTEDFDTLKREIGVEIETLPQLVLQKDVISQALRNQLKKKGNKALDAALEMTVALARDLQYDFYPYFPDFFRLICGHLDTQDAELLERIFMCLAYLYKYLWRYMVKDIEPIFGLYVPLLGDHHKDYVRDFAAESFAFLMRKVPDKEHLLNLVFRHLETNACYTEGIGKLLFEMVKGIKGQLHSCAETVLPLLLGPALGGNFGCPTLNRQALHHTFVAMAAHLGEKNVLQNTALVWKCFQDVVTELVAALNGNDKGDSAKSAHLEKVLSLVHVWVTHKNGALVCDVDTVGKILECMVGQPEFTPSWTEQLLEVVCIFIKSKCPASACRLIALMCSGNYTTDTVLTFTQNMVDFPAFDKDVLPQLLIYCVRLEEKSAATALLAEVILKRKPLCLSGEEVQHWMPLPLDFASRSTSTEGKQDDAVGVLEQTVASFLALDVGDVSSLPLLWVALVCLPHLRLLRNEQAEKSVSDLIVSIRDRLLSKTLQQNASAYAFLFFQAVLAAVQCKLSTALAALTFSDFKELLRMHRDDVHLLRATDIFLMHAERGNADLLSPSLLEEFYQVLEDYLSSPYGLIRLACLRIISHFHHPLPEVADTDAVQTSIFKIMLHAEKVPNTVQRYRERLKHLQKLSASTVEASVPTGPYEMAPLKYLIGTLFINFQVLWKPVQDILVTHASAEDRFWVTFFRHLRHVNASIVNYKPPQDCFFEHSDHKCEDLATAAFSEALQSASELKENPDYVNHRHLLWGAAEQVATVERRNKEVVTVFYEFLEQEFWTNTSEAPYHNVEKSGEELELPEAASREPELSKQSDIEVPNDPSVILIEPEEADEEEIGNDDQIVELEDNCKEEHPVESQPMRDEITKRSNLAPKAKSNLIRSLCDHLRVLAKFTNPKAASRSKELHQLYLDLLAFKDTEVQKLAFDCILTYKHKFLETYKDNFRRLLDDKTFKTEVVFFRVDAEGGAVQEDDRKELLPLLMRVLHGKMHMRSGSNTGGKHRFTDRQAIVLRFLASCKEDEIQAFIDLELTTLKEYQQSGSPLEMVKQIKKSLDVRNIVPIRRLHGMLTTVESMLKYLGGLIPNLLSELLKLILAAVVYADTLLSLRDRVVRSVLGNTRLLRSRGIHLLAWFFNKFNKYEFTSEEIEAVFETAVWPLLPFLESGSKLKPSPLLMFFVTISRNPRYFVLFSKFKEDDPTISPLPPIISLLSNTNLPLGILKLLLSLINNLLSLDERENRTREEDEETAQPPPRPIVVSSCLELKGQNPEKHGEVALGRLLLMPYVPHILERLKLVIETAIRTKKSVSAVTMNILCTISKDLTAPAQCSELAKLFITGFKKLRSKAPDAEQQKLTTILNLVKTADHPEEVVRALAPHFAGLTSRVSRQLLASIYSVIGTRDKQYQRLATFVQKVNAWNPRFAEEPDFESRLDGLKLGVEIVRTSSTSPDVSTVLVVIYNCTYAMRTATDFSLRDSASDALSQMVEIFSVWLKENHEAYRTCVTEALLVEIKRGLCCKTEANRHECILILSMLLQHCGEHPTLSALKKLCHQDNEVDFWQNIRHMQLHRRARALKRLSSLLRSGELQPSQGMLMDIILPLASSFLLNDSYAKNGGLVDAAIDAVSAISSLLPWRGYEHLLSYYLNLLRRESEHHSTVVRLVVSILDSFHFDLSKSRGLGKDAQQQQLPASEDAADGDGAVDADSDVEVIDLDKDEAPVADTNVLDEDAATAVHATIVTKLLPRLQRALTEKAKSDDEHKSTRGLPEESERLRIPVAVAMVKLLQVLPHGMLQRYLPGVLLKICQFLRSRLISFRDSARETLLKVMASLGPAYFGYLLQEMRATLQRGYQVHVMMYTAHAVLASLADKIKPGDLDGCFESVIEVCHKELFTEIAEEKEVTPITGKVKEAKATKSYDIYKLLATVATEDTLPKLTAALQSVLLTSVSHKVVKKCEDCLNRVVNGLTVNSTLPAEKLLIHVYGIVNKHSADMNPTAKKKPAVEPRLLSEREDVFLLPREPARDGLPVKTSKRTNTHIIVEFGLKILHVLLKRERLSPSEKKHLEMLDPFVPLLTNFVESSYIKVVIMSLRCFVRLLRMELPSLQTNVPKLARSVFVLLHKYAGAGMKQGDNFELLVLSFKVITILLKEPDLYTADDKQLVVLLGYVESDLYDHTKQSAAFALLKAILSRKMDSEELHELMEKVAKMSITEEKEHVRSQCREAYLQYVLDYPMKKRMRKAVGFFVAQLSYEIESGRASALEMLNAYSAHFPPATLEHYAGTLFVAMAAMLVNDTSPTMRRLASAGIKSLMLKLNDNSRSSLFAIVISWMKSKMFAMLRLAAQVIGIFAETEKGKFERFLPDLLPLVVHHMKPEKFQELTVEDIERTKDHIAYQFLVSLAKMALACNVVRNPLYHEQMGKIIEYATELLLHPHTWVRLAAAQLFGAIFASYDVGEFVDACQEGSASQEYLLQDCASKVCHLTEKFCSQFKASEIVPELAEQAVKNLVFVSKVSWRLTQGDVEDGPGRVHSLTWILKKVELEARLEVSADTKATLKRSSVFKFVAAVALDLPREELLKHLHIILRPICRELEDKTPKQDESLKNLANEVIAVLKKAAGADAFNSTLVKLQAELSGRKLKRKRDKALEAVSNPEVSARRKMKRQLAKSVSQKRKLAAKRGKNVKRRKT